MKCFNFIIFLFIILIITSSCSKNYNKNPNRVYMPDMYYSEAYEPYSDPFPNYKNTPKKIQNTLLFKKETTSLLPVKGTVPRTDFYESQSNIISEKGFEYSKKIKISPIRKIKNFEEIIKEGKNLYYINCSVCHGKNGDGEGILVKNEKIFGIPNYKDRDLSVGSIYYTVTYGKNNMNSYSSQLNKEDRWKVSEYVMYLKNNHHVSIQ